MAKNISIGYINGFINGIKVNSDIRCNSDNFEGMANRSVAYIVMHYTGNSKDIAKANANYFAGSGRKASAHFFVDDSNIYQSVAIKDKAWHCGTSGTYYHNECRNSCSIGIEMCCTAGNYRISDTTKENAAQLCAHLCNMIGISEDRVDQYVVRHYDVTHKNCPAQMAGFDNSEWNAFRKRVKQILGGNSFNSGSDNTSDTGYPTTPFTVKVLVSDLNIRKQPAMGNNVVGQTGKGVFTIVSVNDGWGKLKSGAGWIYLENKEYVTVLGGTSSGKKQSETKKSIDEIADEVINGKWGNGADRKKRLEAAGYNYAQVQAAVNRKL